MRRPRPISVIEQAMLCIALGLLSSLLWFVLPLVHAGPSPALSLWVTLLFLTSVGTILTSAWFGHDLRNGVESERWPHEEIERFRSIFDTPFVRGVYFALALAAALFVFYAFVSGHHLRASGPGLLVVLSQTFTQVIVAARRTKTRTPDSRIDWRTAPRVTSDHWGQGT